MAEIHPEFFPEDRNHEVAEKRVFEKLKKLPAYFEVFYHREFRRKKPGEKKYYEIDFIVTDLRNGRFNGVICIEVKGGLMKVTGGDRWSQNGRNLSEDESPCKQALSGVMNLVAKRHSEIERNLYYDWMVCFPDSGDPGSGKLPDMMSADQLIGYGKFQWLDKTIESYFDILKKENPKRRGVSIQEYDLNFKSPMVKDCGLIPTLSSRITGDEKAFIKMTQQQAETFRSARFNPKLLIRGPAGSGKTIIAKELAQEYYELGFNVLFLCYNRILAAHIRDYFSVMKRFRVSSSLEELNEELEVMTEKEIWKDFGAVMEKLLKSGKLEPGEKNFIRVEGYHSFAYSVIEAADPGWWIRQEKNEMFWAEVIPDKLLGLINEEKIYTDYDVVIIDEGQDFPEMWSETILYLCKSGGKFYVFKDELQNVNQKPSRIAKNPNEKALDMPTVYLDKNCRNTRKIAARLSDIIGREIPSMEEIPDGEKVEVIKYRDDREQHKLVLETLRDLFFRKEQFTPDHILILLNTSYSDSCLSQAKKVDNLPLKKVNKKGELSRNSVNFTQIKYFKGLEADIVLIIDMDPDKFIYDEQVLYTQASRAKHKLYIFEKE